MADKKFTELTNAGAITGTEILAMVQGGNSVQVVLNLMVAGALGALSALTLDTATNLAANSDTRIPSQKAVKAYIDGLLAANDAMVYKGVQNCSGNPNYPAADAGWTYRVSVAGKIGGASGPNVEVGDLLICNTDGTVSGNHATVGAAWNIIQTNIDGALTTAAIGVTIAAMGANTFTGHQNLNGYRLLNMALATVGEGTAPGTSGAVTIDWSANSHYVQPEPTGNITYTFTAPPGKCHLQLRIDSDGTSASSVITWPGTVFFYGNTAYAATLTNKKAIISMYYDGTNYHLMGVQQV